MEYVLLLITLLGLTSTGHAHLFSKRFMQSVAPIFESVQTISHIVFIDSFGLGGFLL